MKFVLNCVSLPNEDKDQNDQAISYLAMKILQNFISTSGDDFNNLTEEKRLVSPKFAEDLMRKLLKKDDQRQNGHHSSSKNLFL